MPPVSDIVHEPLNEYAINANLDGGRDRKREIGFRFLHLLLAIVCLWSEQNGVSLPFHAEFPIKNPFHASTMPL